MRAAKAAKHPATALGSGDSFRLLVQGINDQTVILLSPEGRIVSWNEGAERLHGYCAEEIVGEHISHLYPPDAVEQGLPAQELQTALEVGWYEEEGWRLKKDGTLFWAFVRVSALYDAEGEFIGYSKVARDVTARRETDEALRLVSVYTRSLIEASLDPLVTIGPDGRIMDVNGATQTITGFTREELIGTDFFDYFTEPEQARAGYQRAFLEGSVRDYPLELRHRDGRITSVAFNAQVYSDEDGQVIGVIAAARDISEQKRTQQRIQAQSTEIMELSTPIMQVWPGVVVAPLIGSPDSERTQQFLERLLERIVATSSPVALVDITGVPTIDTERAQHLIETVAAVRLLGAQVVLTGVRPAIAQTLVHLGIDMSGFVTRSSLSAGLQVALDILELQIVSKSGSR